MNTQTEDKDLADLFAAQQRVPAEAAAARKNLDAAKESFAVSRRAFHSVSARASLGQATAADAKKAERALDEAADGLRKAEDMVEILSEKVAVLATAIADTRARRRARVLPDLQTRGAAFTEAAAAAFARLEELVGEARELRDAIDKDFRLDTTSGGFAIHAPGIEELNGTPSLVAFLASKAVKDTLERFARVAAAS